MNENAPWQQGAFFHALAWTNWLAVARKRIHRRLQTAAQRHPWMHADLTAGGRIVVEVQAAADF